MPSTEELTNRISAIQFPTVNKAVPVIPVIYKALSRSFYSVNFELILHAVEQLLSLAHIRAGDILSDQSNPPIAAFVAIMERYNFLNNWSVLHAARDFRNS
jgi:hypothetical protein